GSEGQVELPSLPFAGSMTADRAVSLAIAAGAALTALGIHALVAYDSAILASNTVRVLRHSVAESYSAASWERQSLAAEGEIQEGSTVLCHQAAQVSTSIAAAVAGVAGLVALIVSALLVNPGGAMAAAAC